KLNASALINFIAELCHVHKVCFEVGFAPHAEGVNTLSIDGILDLMFVFQSPSDTQIRAKHSHCKGVITIKRKSDLRQNSTHGANRHSFQVNILRSVLPDTECVTRRPDVRIPYGERTDLPSGVHITLQQHW